MAGLGIALVGSVDSVFGADTVNAAGSRVPRGKPVNEPVGYGPLVTDPAGVLSLPEGFSYTVVAQSGVSRLDSGELTPSDPDGTACFVRHGADGSLLINNHEISGSEPFPVPHLPDLVYDPRCNGGTTNIEVDKNGKRVREYVSLAGTHNNCAGGRTPWETWLSCEETEAIFDKRHGYVFEVDPHDQEANTHPKPIKAMGRFAHEAVAVDPQEHRIYQTEDASGPNGLLYRFTPPESALPLRKGGLRALADRAGTLEAMAAYTARGAFVADLSAATEPGTKYRTAWVSVPDRDARGVPTRVQFGSDQVTRSRKLEGMWWAHGGAYFVSSFARISDGSQADHDGQVWFLDPLAGTIELKLRFAYTPSDQDGDVDGPDNITVSPYGGVI
ncbi:MAG TPA: alkaline phosphatase PhoX, partial [Segeticoccus sp.]|uniref:alkaline phosphatase PhoX n=1 Tax=Segeticoccus sp. TaxID=2706531 RepID=UPI002D7FED43